MIRLFPAPGPMPGDNNRMEAGERARLRAAALQARRIYPGELGLLAHRELMALADLGVGVDRDALIPRLATAILATEPPRTEARDA
jgi:hypothetical protein